MLPLGFFGHSLTEILNNARPCTVYIHQESVQNKLLTRLILQTTSSLIYIHRDNAVYCCTLSIESSLQVTFCLDTLYLRDDYNFIGHLPNSYSMCEDASFEVILPLLESQLI